MNFIEEVALFFLHFQCLQNVSFLIMQSFQSSLYNKPRMRTNFPRLYREEGDISPITDQQLRQTFPWGCSQINHQTELPTDYVHFKIIFPSPVSNIFTAIKYGIWSSAADYYEKEYVNFKMHKAKNIRTYYAFCCRNQERASAFAIAQVVDFCPNECFKYWAVREEHEHYPYLGIIKMKFVLVGEAGLDKFNQVVPDIDTFRKIWRDLQKTPLSIQIMQYYDWQEDRIRAEYQEDPTIQKRLLEYSVRLAKLDPAIQSQTSYRGRQNYRRYR